MKLWTPMYGIDVKTLISEKANEERLAKISSANTGKIRSEEHKKNYPNAAKSRKWIVHRNGQICSTVDPNDPRFNHPDWQRGKKWK